MVQILFPNKVYIVMHRDKTNSTYATETFQYTLQSD